MAFVFVSVWVLIYNFCILVVIWNVACRFFMFKFEFYFFVLKIFNFIFNLLFIKIKKNKTFRKKIEKCKEKRSVDSNSVLFVCFLFLSLSLFFRSKCFFFVTDWRNLLRNGLIFRATLEQMRQAAAATSSDNRNGTTTTTTNTNLVNNAQPLSFTSPPFDSNV